MSSIRKTLVLIATALLATMLSSAPAYAQSTRTWVSGTGSDSNPCTRALPCLTFAAAVAVTTATGEVNCVDAGGFGPVTITKSLSIICDNTNAGIMVGTNATAITINAGSGDTIVLSGLELVGVGGASYGINFIGGAVLHVRNTTIRGFWAQGINLPPSPGRFTNLFMKNVYVSECGTPGAISSGGVRVTVGSNGQTNVVMTDTRIILNRNAGLRLDTTGATNAKIRTTIKNSEFVYSGIGIQMKASGSTGVELLVDDSEISNNANVGVLANGAGVQSSFTHSSIVLNQTGLSALNGAQIQDRDDNILGGNVADGAWTPRPPVPTPIP